jgi:2-desacetyl-2-hydroxyethyl bacteriochlorophyllide A dehydrogenase
VSISSKAIIVTDERKASPGELELPEPGKGEVLVKTYCSGISIGSERWVFTKRYKGTNFPCVSGYQKTGMVEKVGPGVDCVKVGDMVFLRSTRIASDIRSIWGGHTSYSVESAESLISVPEGVCPMDASLLVVCAVGYYGAAEVMPTEAGELVVVIGQSLIGQ